MAFCNMFKILLVTGAYSDTKDDKSDVFIKLTESLLLYKDRSQPLSNFYISSSKFLYYTKANSLIYENFFDNKWSFIVPTSKQVEVLAFSRHLKSKVMKSNYIVNFDINHKQNDDYSDLYYYKPIFIYESAMNSEDGVDKFIFSTDISYWMTLLLLVDIMKFSCHFDIGLNRFIQVDIDDIFVGKSGTRLRPNDVNYLLQFQHNWRHNYVHDFQFNLGFSGFYFAKSTNKLENSADHLLLKHKKKFNWFSHMFSHKKPHLLTKTQLHLEIKRNEQFADEHQLDRSINYAVAPFHSGVYPVYGALYKLWLKLANVSVSSTEEYPKLNPSFRRKGFIFKKISILPRQTCGIYTHTIYLNRYPHGRNRLDQSILGGSLFFTIIFNYVNIFMTHFSNYGGDRLGLYTFDGLFRFLECYTNIVLIQKSPKQLARIYFDKYPKEKAPVWFNPCNYKRHIKILPITYSCNLFPKFIILGPQKTGTTAIWKFLQINPEFQTNGKLQDTFEEIQFFSSNKYYNGIEWYLSLFDKKSRVLDVNNTTMYFEKSATYFDSPVAIERIHNLLPNIKLVIMLKDPILRAYSWYQHMLAHEDETALNNTFYQVVTASNYSDLLLQKLSRRCLYPGLYATHLKNWMKYYIPNNIILLDSEQLIKDPITIMNNLQLLLSMTNVIDYSNHLEYNTKKGFYCITKNHFGHACLGRGKGRNYQSIDEMSLNFLKEYYLQPNNDLRFLLKSYGFTNLPEWLK